MRRPAAVASLVLLILVSVPLAAPGPGLVPAASDGGPGWLAGIYGGGLGVGGDAYYGLLWAAFVAYLGVVTLASALPRRLLTAAVIALVGAFVLAPPLLSQDVFSYIAYARLGTEYGLNPYDTAPDAVPGDSVLAYVGWRDSVSAYGPLFTLASFPLGPLGVPAALWTLKAAAGLAVLALAWLTSRLAADRGLDPAAAGTLVGLNPLILVHVVGGAHNDSVMMLVAMAGVAAVLAGAQRPGAVGLVLAAATKVSAAFAAPFALLGAERRRAFLAAALAATAAMTAVSLLAFGTNAFDALGIAGENQSATSRYSIPATTSRIIGVDVDVVRAVALAIYAAAVIALLAGVARGGDWVRAAGWAALGLLLATGWLLPWYLIWALPLAAIARDRALVAAVLALTAFQLVNRLPL